MKKILLKSIILSIIMILAISLKSFAQSTYRFYCRDGLNVNAGETIEVPIYIDNIKIEGIEKKIFSFTGTIEYNSDVFELVPFNENGNSCILKINDELEAFGIIVKYDSETKVISTTLDVENNQEYFNGMTNSISRRDDSYEDKYLNKAIQVGTIKVKAKENAESGDYLCTISNLKADNGEGEFASTGLFTKIHINQKNLGMQEDYTSDEEAPATRQVNKNQEESKKANYKVEVSSNGRKITITPDEENGVVIKSIICKNKQLSKKDGKFVFTSEPNMAYEFFIYGTNGEFIENKVVTTMVKEGEGENENEGNNNPGKNDNEGQGNKDNDSEKKDENSGSKDENSGSKDENSGSKDDNSEHKGDDSNNEGNKNNNGKDGVKKSPQTGDYIIFAIVTLATMIAGVLWTIIPVKKQKNA